MYPVNDSDSKATIPYTIRNNWHFQHLASGPSAKPMSQYSLISSLLTAMAPLI